MKIRRTKNLVVILMAAGLVVIPAIRGFTAGDPKQGQRTYNQYCVPCHGKEGRGDGTRAMVEQLDPKPRNHTDGTYMNKRTDLQLFKVDREGGKANTFSHLMPQWKHILSDEEIWDVIAHIRTLAEPPYVPQGAQ